MCESLLRAEVIHSSRTWVVKVGSNVLASPDGTLDNRRIESLAEEIVEIKRTGRRVILVSSGAVGAGMGQMGLKKRPQDLPGIQAAAAIGQTYLMRAYEEAFKPKGYHAAQILLTHSDFDSRARYLNVRNTISTLFEYQAVPIINENDTVSVDEIKFGDNDRLAAMVANLVQAELLVILSSVDGLCQPLPDGGGFGDPVPVLTSLDEEALALVTDSRSSLGTGGMGSKLASARLVTHSGGSVIIASGKRERPLTSILECQPIGTLILAEGQTRGARQRWIGLTARPKGRIRVDSGAVSALVNKGGSLLAIGIVEIEGDFEKGDVVAISDFAGEEFARGLANYGSADARRVKGLKKEQLRKALESSAVYDEVVHRDNLVILPK
ncbi:glutamate 5-kinase [bacterium]|nr:glutamate 5-kinase [bacterium]